MGWCGKDTRERYTGHRTESRFRSISKVAVYASFIKIHLKSYSCERARIIMKELLMNAYDSHQTCFDVLDITTRQLSWVFITYMREDRAVQLGKTVANKNEERLVYWYNSRELFGIRLPAWWYTPSSLYSKIKVWLDLRVAFY